MENTFNAWGSNGNSSFPTYDFPNVVNPTDDDKTPGYMFGSGTFSPQRVNLPVDGGILPGFGSGGLATPIDTFDFNSHHHRGSYNNNSVQFPPYSGLSSMMDGLSLQPSNPIVSSSLPVVDPFQIASFAPPPMFSKPSNSSVIGGTTNTGGGSSSSINNSSTNNNNSSNVIDDWSTEPRGPMLSAKARDFQPFAASGNNSVGNNPPNGMVFMPGDIPPGMILIDNEGYAYDEDGYLDNGGLYDDDDDEGLQGGIVGDDGYYEGDFIYDDDDDAYDDGYNNNDDHGYEDGNGDDDHHLHHPAMYDDGHNNFYYNNDNNVNNPLSGGLGNTITAPVQGMSYANAALKDFHTVADHVKKQGSGSGTAGGSGSTGFHIGKQEGYQSASIAQYNHHDRRICPFFLQDSCKYGNMCKDSHDMGVQCSLCRKIFTTPDKTGYEESVAHMNNCREMLVIRKEKASSKVHHCNICGKLPFECNERYGILTSCVHAFCLACIKDYRRGESGSEKDQARRCPICRVVSHYVIPCDRYIDDNERKERLITQFQQSLSSIPCAKFNFGNGTCPFGSSCFYAHVDEQGNNLVQRAKFTTAEGEVKLMNDGTLSDLIDWGQGSFKKLKSKKKR